MRGISTPPAVAAQQAGVFTREQAVEAGYTNFRIRNLLAQRRWSVVLGSVYVETASTLTPTSLAHAARLAGGLGVIVSHTTAGAFHTLRVPADPELHVIVERDRRVRIPGLRAHRIEVRDSELVRVGGVVATDLVRTVADLMLWLPEEAGRAVLTDALRRRLCTVDEVRRQLVRMGVRHGRDRAWSVLADLASAPYSEGEVKVHRLMRQAGIDGWVANAPVHDADGLIGFVDLLFAEAKVVVEFDGRAFHTDDVAFQRDRTRQNRLVLAGYVPLRFTWDDVVHRPQHVVAEIRAALRAAA
jgi:hypothetical protein